MIYTLRFQEGYSSKSCDSTRLTYSLTILAVPELILPLFRDCVLLNEGGVGVGIDVKLDTDIVTTTALSSAVSQW